MSDRTRGLPSPDFSPPPTGVKVVAVVACHRGGIDEGEQALRPLREFGPPVLDEIGPVPYTAFQQALDANFPRGRRYYRKSTLVRELSDGAISQLIERSTPFRRPATTPIEHVRPPCLTGVNSRTGIA